MRKITNRKRRKENVLVEHKHCIIMTKQIIQDAVCAWKKENKIERFLRANQTHDETRSAHMYWSVSKTNDNEENTLATKARWIRFDMIVTQKTCNHKL